LLPEPVSALAFAAAFVAGAAIERYRQGRRERPLRLAETPRLWIATARDSVGIPATAIAACAGLAALGVLILPSLSTVRHGPPADGAAEGRRIDRSSLPRLKVMRPASGVAFTVGGARFRVFGASSSAAAVDRGQPRPGRRWIYVGVEGRNLRRSHFNPNHLSYRLADERGNAFYPDLSAGTGPPSLGETGFLGRGETARTRLGFRVPRAARRLSLVFEPLPSGRVQVRVLLAQV
jgi:hypothetical protein